MRSRALLLALVAVCAYAAGASQTIVFPPHLSGAEFIRQWRGTPGPRWEQPLDVQENQIFVQGYLAAVVDLTQGKKWCSPAHMEPGERDDRVIAALGAQESKGNAAEQLLQNYIARFPCP